MGRDSHLQMLGAALDAARGGHARTVTVWGEAGSGKSTLLDAVARTAQGPMRVLRVSGHLAEQDLPYAGVHQLVYLTGLHDVEVGGTGGDPLRDAAMLLASLTALAREQPLLLVVDDAQWLDRLSQRALTFVARRLDADAICVVFGVRSPVPGHLVVGEELEVGPLSKAESVELLRRSYPDMSTRVATHIAATAHGLPLALSEIPIHLSHRQKRGVEPLPDELALGRSTTLLFADRFATLPDATRLCLLAASFGPLPAAAYRHVLHELGCGLADLDAAERVGLAWVKDGRCEFRHALAAAAVRAQARSQERLAVHRVLARHFQDDPVRHAFHVRKDPDVAAAQLLPVLQEGASAARAALSYDEAAQLWTAAAHVEPSAPGRQALLREAVHCLALSGAGPEARALIDRLLGDATELTDRAHVLRDLTWVSLWTQSVAPEDDVMIEAHGVELMESGDSQAATLGQDLLTALATALLGAGEYRRAQRVCRALTAHGGINLTVEQQLLSGVVGVMVGDPHMGAILRRGDTWVDHFPWQRVLDPASPAGFITVVLGWLGEYDTLDRAVAHCLVTSAQHGPSASAMYISNVMTASQERHMGRWDRAVLEFQALEHIVMDSDFAAPYPFIALRHAHLLAARGDVDGCGAQRERAREKAPQWVPILAHLDHSVAGLLALAQRDYATALEHLDQAGRIERQVGLAPSGYLSRVADGFEAAWRLGDAESRLDELVEFEDLMRLMDHSAMLGLATRCRALMAPPATMEAYFAQAVELLSSEPDGFEKARTYLLWGERLRRARRKADAHRILSLAHEVFVKLGASAWISQCESELAACGIRRAAAPQVHAGSPVAQLTPREFEVAREVASGLTNAEAAQRLFISERTVEFHLYNAFRKLGIDGREDLANALG